MTDHYGIPIPSKFSLSVQEKAAAYGVHTLKNAQLLKHALGLNDPKAAKNRSTLL